MENKENSETSNNKSNDKKLGFWFSLFVKISVFMNFSFAIIMIISILVGLSYKEDKSKIPYLKINLLLDDEKFNELQSPLDLVKKDEKANNDENSKSHESDIINEDKPDNQENNNETNILNSPNNFVSLSRKTVESKALDIIDPLPQMILSSYGNQIPIISSEGNVPWKTYSKPFQNYKNNNIKIAILIINVGLNKEIDEKIINAFPDNVSVAFSPYSKNIEQMSRLARQSGKETYINIPFEMKNGGDVGPYGIMSNISDTENTSRFIKAIGKNIAISGIVNANGEDIAVPENTVKKIINLSNQHGLIYVGKEKGGEEEITINYDISLTKNLNRYNIKSVFDDFLNLAIKNKKGMIIVDAKPSALVGTLDFIDDLIKNKDIVLVPVSSFIETKENNWNIVRIINEIS